MSKNANGKYAFGFCDRTGLRYPLQKLKEEYVQGRKTGFRVGPDVWDPDQPQNWLGSLPTLLPDPQSLWNPRPDTAQDASRRMFSWDPVGTGNLLMTSGVGQVKVS